MIEGIAMVKRFGTVLNCIDGRTQIPIIQWMKENFDLDYVDLITEPGMDKVLSQGSYYDISRIKNNAITSISAHDSHIIAVAGHYDCAANPVNDCMHFEDISVSVCKVKEWGLPVKVIGLWVDGYWKVHVVSM
jgi:hypothetical protein